MLHQFKDAVKEALASGLQTRMEMRARSAKQRFPVARWVEDLESLQSTAIKIHQKEASKGSWRRPATPSGRDRRSSGSSDLWNAPSSRDSSGHDRRSVSMSRPITREFFGAPDNSARKESALTGPDTGNGRSL